MNTNGSVRGGISLPGGKLVTEIELKGVRLSADKRPPCYCSQSPVDGSRSDRKVTAASDGAYQHFKEKKASVELIIFSLCKQKSTAGLV